MCCRNAAVALDTVDNWPWIAGSSATKDPIHYGPDTLSKGLPQSVQVPAATRQAGNVTATHDLSPISAALAA
jgi:hypothetical protein